MFRMILLAAMFAVSVTALATSASASTGTGAGKVTFDEAYDDSSEY